MKVEADLVIFNANIITMNPEAPRATALAIKSYKFLTVGDDESVVDLVPTAKRVMDMGRKTIVPGFVDAHTHLTWGGIRQSMIDLSTVSSVEEAKQLLKDALPQYEKGEWVIGYNWDESNWTRKRYITAKDLDSVSQEHPIALTRVDGHLISVNTLGLEKIGVPLDHEGVQRDEDGNPTGILKDIEDMSKKLRPPPEGIKQGVIDGNKLANSHGITTVADNIPDGFLKHIRDVEVEGNLSTRMVVNPPIEQMKHLIALGLSSGLGSPMLRIGGVKIFTDGSIGAATAAVSEHYYRQTENKGMLLLSTRKLKKYIEKAVKADIQTVTHAIGDEAIEMVISIFEGLKDKSHLRRQRHRIEHAEMITEDQIRRAVSLGLILSMQPNFVGRWQQEGGMYDKRLGAKRAAKMNMFRVAIDNGARVCFGSDGMPYGPLYGIWSATTHPNPDVRITVEEALRCYTRESAYALFMEKNVGSIKTGKRADFVVLSDDILSVKKDRIKDISVEMTVVGGIIEYSELGA